MRVAMMVVVMRVPVAMLMVVVVVMVMVVVMAVLMVMVVVMLAMMSVFPTAQYMLSGRQGVQTRPFKGVLGLEKTPIHLEYPLQIKRAHIQNIGDRDISVTAAMNFCRAVDGTYATLDPLQLGRRYQIDFIEKNHIGEGHLFARFGHLVEMLFDMPTIHDRHNGIEQELFLEIIVQKKSLRDRTRVCHTRGFDDDVVEFIAALEQLTKNPQQVAPDSATNATVIGFENFLFGANDELMVDADLAKFVFNDSNALAVVLGENPIQQGGFAGAQKARQDGDGNPILGSHTRCMIT